MKTPSNDMTTRGSTRVAAMLPRRLPDPLPIIHPVAEREADGQLQATYEDTKRVLQVPWMGVVTMAFAHYPRFYATLWQGLRPLYESRQFIEACRRLRTRVEHHASQLAPSPLVADLLEEGYSHRELEEIRALIEVFSHGNMPYLLIASQARTLMEGLPLSKATEVTPAPTTSPTKTERLILMEPHHGNSDLQALYRQIRTTLGLPFVNTDYRALARWPGYFTRAWHDLAPRIDSEAYRAITQDVHVTALELAAELPNPNQLLPEHLTAAAVQYASHEEVLEVTRLFHYLLPGLVTNIAVFRAQLISA
ncbi:halocarboxylic acid dehydrogenase DehI family protein [Halomonas denitrificans]|uniref:halocarboxylic acid dehydrogenase DehI family protein n=1 Tax=Halomonas denitrificans TaxID=370769 RepID=UPI001CD404CE|nr:halocarboxylic acid dehydrogenase DehI family protein [Halomonas denitrificans]MCA0975017.1 halocarboxylic acid dehydrogenase DehI family protein [Halomonas denitrificans]